jgi:large subunit ribosomal protein L15
MQLHNVHTGMASRTRKRIGRGGKRGKTSGRGTKGQKARAGHRIRPEARDIIKRIPKRRGFGKNRARTVSDAFEYRVIVNLNTLENRFEGGAVVSPATLLDKGVISRRGGKFPEVKLLGDGELSKKLSVSGCLLSKSAREAIEKAGGTVAA